MWEEWLQLLWRHRGKILGTLLGLFAGWFIVAYGVVKFLFVVALTVIGLAVGARADGENMHVDWDALRRRWRG